MKEIEKDYGFDPLGNGMVRMVPSGEILSAEGARELLNRRTQDKMDTFLIGTLTAAQVQAKQGGKLN